MPWICAAEIEKWKCAMKKNRQHSNILMGGNLACLLLLPCYHKKQMIALPCQHGLHIAAAATTGTSSLTAMFSSNQLGGHCNWNHLFSQTPPQPQPPEASESTWRSGGPGMELIPFQCSAKRAHQYKSAWAVWFNLSQWWGTEANCKSSIKPHMKVQPGPMIDAAWLSRPSSKGI